MKSIPLPPTSITPQPYSGPSAEEVLAMRKQFLNPAIFTTTKSRSWSSRARVSALRLKRADATSTVFGGL